MEQEHQERYYQLGRNYWWLAGKYRIVRDVLDRLRGRLPESTRILDLGCGPGNMLDLIEPFGRVYGSDYSADALRFCRGRGHHRLFRADFQQLDRKSTR